MQEDKSFKVIVIGAPGSGKSCMLNRYTKNQFIQGYNTTLGVEFTSKFVQIDQDTKINLQIWDTAGQESFKSIIKTFYKNVSAVFLVYNIASENSFNELQFWHQEALQNCNQDVIFVLIGAQKDREAERQVTKQSAQKFMHDKSISFMFETSAKNNDNISISFEQTAKQIFLKKITKSLENNKKLKQKNKKEKKKCCS